MIEVMDFWAEWCIDPRTPVLLDNSFEFTFAGKVEEGDKIYGLDIESKVGSSDLVKSVKLTPNVKKFLMSLETGRSLVASEFHPVLTKEGWKFIKYLTSEDMVFVKPVSDLFESDLDEDYCNEIVLTSVNHAYSNDKLKGLGILPLRYSDPKLIVLARLFGLLITDGYMYEYRKGSKVSREVSFSVGTKEDANAVREDLKKLGFSCEVKEQIKKRSFEGRAFIQNVIRVRNNTSSLLYLLKALGAPVGRKKCTSFGVPHWVKSSSKTIKRWFLSGWISGDGPKVIASTVSREKRVSYTGIKVNDIEFHKEAEFEKDGLSYAKDLSSLLADFGVKVKRVYSKPDNDGVVIHISLSNSYESTLNLVNISYFYAHTKELQSQKVAEFLRYRLFVRNNYINDRIYSSVLIKSGYSTADVSSMVGRTVSVVNGWKYSEVRNFGLPQEGEPLFFNWVCERAEQDYFWEKVVEVKEVESGVTVGISTGTNTLITSGVVSHNCGPCHAMHPIVEEAEKAYAGKIKFTKVNVDESAELAGKHAVMSIPTYLALKDGVEIERKIGAMTRDTFFKWLDGLVLK